MLHQSVGRAWSGFHFPALPEFLPQGTHALGVSDPSRQRRPLRLCHVSHSLHPKPGHFKVNRTSGKAKTLQDASRPWALKDISRSLVFHSYNGKKNNLFPEHMLLSSTVVGLKLQAAQSPPSHGVCMKEAGRERSTYMKSKHRHQPLRNAGATSFLGKDSVHVRRQ